MIAVHTPIRLPQPSGRLGIGTVTYHWVDGDREEPFTADPADRREILVQVWYPTAAGSGRRAEDVPRAPYVDDVDALRPLARLMRIDERSFEPLRVATTNAVPFAPVVPGPERFPVIVLSHGRCGYRQESTILAEDLVSHGFIVAAIDHPYAASGVRFPDGRLVSVDPRVMPVDGPGGNWGPGGFVRGIVPLLAEDVRFAFRMLENVDRRDTFGLLTDRLDLDRRGVGGLSLGGMTAAEASMRDPRLDACLIVDAPTPRDVVHGGLTQPTMWLTRDATTMRNEGWSERDIADTHTSMRTVFEELPVDGYIVRVPGMYHPDFSDLAFLGRFVGATAVMGRIPGPRARQIVSAFATAFYGRHLDGSRGELLDEPPDRYPEVLFETRRPWIAHLD